MTTPPTPDNAADAGGEAPDGTTDACLAAAGTASAGSGAGALPERADIARDLLRRRALAERAWTPSAAALTEEQRGAKYQVDRANAEVLRRILADHGWPGPALVGSDAARAAWLIALHADDIGLQRFALEKLTEAVTRGEAEPAHWAHLYDRCCALAGLPQLYGTQFRHGPNGIEAYPIAEPATLDARRARCGLEPYAVKAEELRRRHEGEAA